MINSVYIGFQPTRDYFGVNVKNFSDRGSGFSVTRNLIKSGLSLVTLRSNF